MGRTGTRRGRHRPLCGATRESVYRVPLGATEIEVLWRTAKEDGPTADGALLDGAYFFGSLERLRSVRVAEDRGATNH